MNRKQVILEVATRLFAEKGFKETSMAEICKLSKTAEGTIFYHFKNKEDIYLSILDNVREGMIKEFKQYIENNQFQTGIDMMEGIIAFYLNLAVSKEEWFLLLQRQYPYELARINPVCRGHLEAIYNCLIDMVEQAILTGQHDGSVGVMPSRKTAFIIFSMINGLVWFKISGLYDAGALYKELIGSCRKILTTSNHHS